MEVRQFHHANQFLIYSDDTIMLQSYKTIVAGYVLKSTILFLYEKWDYSLTTLRHIYMFINEMLGTNIHSKKELNKLLNKQIFIK